jgi:hypothetical protein
MTSRIILLATALSFCVCLLIGCGSNTSDDPKIKGNAPTENIPKKTPSGGGGVQQGKSTE